MMTGGSVLLLTSGSVGLLALLLCLRLLRTVRRLQKRVQHLEQHLAEQPLSEPQPASFSASLGQAERRVEATTVSLRGMSQGDKYRYVASLAQQGLDATGIAAALQMSPAEVEQLLALAQLRPQGQNLS